MAFRASAIITEIPSTPGPGIGTVRQPLTFGPVVDRTPVAVIPPTTGLRELAFDGLMSVGHETGLETTSYPVERGADLFDHTYETPNMIRMVGGVSLVADASPLTAWALIQQLRLSRKLVTISTNIGAYTNMILKRASTLEDKDTQGAILVKLEFRELIIANAEGPSFATVASGPAMNRYTATVNRGFQESIVVGEEGTG